LARVQLSTRELDINTAKADISVLFLSLGIALAGIVVGTAFSTRTLRPLRTLARSMEELGRGIVRPLPVSRGDEIGQLIASFNRMAGELEEKKKLATELAANEKVIALGRIAAGVAHEVNNPLAGMLNCLSTLRAKSNDPALVTRYLPLIEMGLKKIEALVKDLLIELRVEDAQEFADSSCLEDIRDLIAAEIDPTRVTLAWDNKLGCGDSLNRPRVQQILLNLLRNSIQAMPNGGHLLCRFWSDQETYILEIKDTGQGISPENVGRIFDPFFTTRPAGTGLGLWIVLRLVHSMQGHIDVTSVPGEGTQFRILIPRESTIATLAV
jgi:two-component system NtrC family sensor kinase